MQNSPLSGTFSERNDGERGKGIRKKINPASAYEWGMKKSRVLLPGRA